MTPLLRLLYMSAWILVSSWLIFSCSLALRSARALHALPSFARDQPSSQRSLPRPRCASRPTAPAGTLCRRSLPCGHPRVSSSLPEPLRALRTCPAKRRFLAHRRRSRRRFWHCSSLRCCLPADRRLRQSPARPVRRAGQSGYPARFQPGSRTVPSSPCFTVAVPSAFLAITAWAKTAILPSESNCRSAFFPSYALFSVSNTTTNILSIMALLLCFRILQLR